MSAAALAGPASTRSQRMSTRFMDLQPETAASGVGVVVVPGAGWGASVLQPACAGFTATGHRVLLCEPAGIANNPGAFFYNELYLEVAMRLADWNLPCLLVLAHSMGAYTASRLAATDARI